MARHRCLVDRQRAKNYSDPKALAPAVRLVATLFCLIVAAPRNSAGAFDSFQLAPGTAEQAARRAREDRFRVLFDRASDGIMIVSPAGKLIAVNESFARMHGYRVEEMLNLSLKDLDAPETSRLAPERLRSVESGESLFFEAEHYHKDGHVFPLEVSASEIVSGGETLIQAFHRDITARKLAEEENTRQLDELRRWQAVMLEREDRVMDLKREVNELLRRLGNPIRYPSQEGDENSEP
jgi:PAS domain S-box-containing protein